MRRRGLIVAREEGRFVTSDPRRTVTLTQSGKLRPRIIGFLRLYDHVALPRLPYAYSPGRARRSASRNRTPVSLSGLPSRSAIGRPPRSNGDRATGAGSHRRPVAESSPLDSSNGAAAQAAAAPGEASNHSEADTHAVSTDSSTASAAQTSEAQTLVASRSLPSASAVHRRPSLQDSFNLRRSATAVESTSSTH